MLTLTWKQINDEDFARGLMKLNNAKDLDAVTAYRVGRVFNKVISEMKRADAIDRGIIEKHRQTIKEEGKPDRKEWIDAESEAKAKAEFDVILENTKFELKVWPLERENLKCLTNGELAGLAPILKDMPVEE